MSTRVYTKFFMPVFFLIALIPLVSCQIGLGAAVDTEAPTLQITYPPASSVIKGTFTLAGTCSDDQSVSSIAVNVRNITTSASTPYTISSGQITGGTDWKLSLNTYDSTNSSYNGWQFPDGKYEITVTASDASGHTSGSTARSVIIDNTPPVLILSSPLKTGTGDPSTYGRTIKLAGDIADDNTISSLAMTLYPYDTATSTLSSSAISLDVTNFSQMSSDNPLVVARYYTAAEAGTDTSKLALRTNYLKIYNNGPADSSDIGTAETKTYYCGIILTDNSKTFTTPGDSGSGTGNATTAYYINNTENFYDKLMSESTYSLTALKLKDILNGTSSEYTAAQITAIKKILSASGNSASSTDITVAASSKISINPSNDPHYSVSGYAIGSSNTYADAETGYRSSTTGSSFTVSLSAGLDKYYIKPSSVSIVLKDTTENTSQTVLAAGSWTDDDALSADYTFSLDATKYTLVSNDYYTIEVTGEDRNGNDLYPSNEDGYGFMLKNIHSNPVVEFEDQSGTAFFGTNDVYYSASTIKNTVIPVKVGTDGLAMDADTPLVISISGSPSLTYTEAYTGNSGYYYYYTITITDIGTASTVSDKSKYTLSVTAKDAENDTGSATGYFYLDDKTPSAVISTVTPTVSRSLDNSVCVNGTVTVSGTVTESNLSSVVLTVSDTDGHTNAIDFGAAYSFSQAVDTTQYGGTLTLTLTATDTVGNTVSTKASYVVDQSTDAPVITLSNADISIKEASGITSGTNLFGTTGNNKLLGTISDDDGVASVTVGYRDCGSTGNYTSTQALSGGSSTTYSLSYTLPSAEKQYDILITVTDTKKESTGYSSTGKGFVLAVDAGAPVFSNVTPANGGYYSASKPLTVAGTVTDGSGSITIQAAGNGTSALTAAAHTETAALYTIADTVTPPAASGSYSIVYTAADKYGQSSSYTVNYTVDVTPPAVTLEKLGGVAVSSANMYLKKENTYTVSGSVSDLNSDGTTGSGVSEAGYVIYEGTTTSDDTAKKLSGSASVSGNTWNTGIDFSTLTEGTYTIVITAADNAGNTNSTAGLTVYADASAPEITGVPTLASYYKKGALGTVSGTASDTWLKSVTLTQTCNGKAVTAPSNTGTAADWTFAPDSGTDGSWVYTITAEDKAGRTAGTTLSTIVDATAPVLTSQTVTPVVDSTKVNGEITVSCSATDTYLNSLTVTAAGKKSENSYTEDITNTGTVYSFTGTLETTDFDNDTILNITFTATDKAGNSTSVTKSYTIDEKTDTPSVTLDSPAEPDKSGIAVGTNLFTSSDNLTGTITDDDGIATVTIILDSNKTTINAGGAKTYSLSQGLGTLAGGTIAQGTHTCTIAVEDNSTDASHASYGKKTTGPFSIGIDNGAPVLSLTNTDKIGTTVSSKIYTNDGFSITGTVQDGYELAELSWKDAVTTSGSVSSSSSGTVDVAQNSQLQNWTIAVDKPETSESVTRTFTAKDKFGRTTTQTFTWVFDIDTPAVSDIAINSGSGTGTGTESDPVYFNSSKTLSITGNASDGGASGYHSGLSDVKYAVVQEKPTDGVITLINSWADATAAVSAGTASLVSDWQLTSGTSSWTAKVDLIGKNEGNYTVFIKAEDNAGNTVYSAGQHIVADSTAPTLTETDTVGTYTNGAFTLSGNVNDTNLLSVTSTGSVVTGSDTASSVSSGNGTWTLAQTVLGTGSYSYKYTITATDRAGNKSYITDRSVTIDRTAPTVKMPAFTSPNNSTSYQFSGGASDGEGGSGLKEVYVWMDSSGTPATAKDTNASTVTPDQNGGWTWNKYSVTAGTYYLHALAVDYATNLSIDTPEELTVDLTAPASTIGVPSGTLHTAGTTTDVSTPAWNGSYITKGAFTLAGTASDDHDLDATSPVTLTINNKSTSFTSLSGGEWTYTQTAADGTYVYTVTMKDKAGNQSQSTVTVLVDTTNPVVTITAPSAGTNQTAATIDLTGTVSDSGSGVASMTYSVTKTDNSDTYAHATIGSTDTELKDIPVTPSDGSWKVNDLNLTTSSKLILSVTVKDYLENSKTESVAFYRDSTAPDLSTQKITTTGGTDVTAGETTTTWYKTSSLAISVLAADTESGVSGVSYSTDNSSWNAMSLYTGDEYSGTWTASSITCENGSKKIYIKAKNTAGKESGSVTIVTNVDTEKPTVGSVSVLDSVGTALTNVTASKIGSGVYLTMTSTDATSGTQQMWLTKGTDTTALVTVSNPNDTKTDEWTLGNTAMKIPASAFKTGGSYTDGIYTFYVHSADFAGNESTSAAVSITIDTTAPTLTVDTLKNGKIFTQSDVTGITSGTPYTATYKATGTWSDATSGTSVLQYTTSDTPASVTDVSTATTDEGKAAEAKTKWVTVSGTTSAAGVTLSWTAPVTIPESSAGSSLSFRAEDKYGNTSTVSSDTTSFTGMTFDYSVPVVTLTPSSTTSTNAAYTLTGVVTDRLAMSTAESYGFTISATKNGNAVDSAILGGLTVYSVGTVGTSYQFVITIPKDADNHTYDGLWAFIVDAQDKAGQSAVQKTTSVTIDTTAPTGINNTVPSGWQTDSSTQSLAVNVSDSYDKTNSKTLSSYSGISKVTYTVKGASTKAETMMSAGSSYSGNNAYTTYSTILSLGQGSNDVIITAYDTAGNKAGIGTYTYQIDTTGPVLSSVSAADTQISAAGATTGVYLNATATDVVSGTTKMWVTEEGTDTTELVSAVNLNTTETDPWTLDSTGGLLIPSEKLIEGSHTFYVHAKDIAGNTSTSGAVSITVDITAPTLTVSNLTDNGIYTEANVNNFNTSARTATYTVSGTWRDATSGTSVLQYTTSDTPANVTDVSTATTDAEKAADAKTKWVTVSGTTSAAGVTVGWTAPVTVTESSAGTSLSFRAEDKYGNTSEPVTRSGLTFDFSAPTASFTSTSGTSYKYTGDTQTITVVGRVTDSYSIASAAGSATLNDTAVTSGTDGLEITTGSVQGSVGSNPYIEVTFKVTVNAASGDEDGIWAFSLKGEDAAGRSATSVTSSSITVDTLPPKFTVVTADNTTVGTTTVAKYFAATSGKYQYTLSGIIRNEADVKTNASGVSALYYILLPSGVTPEGTSSYTIGNVTSGGKTYSWNPVDSLSFTTKSDKTVAWSTTVDISSDYSLDTLYNVYFAAKDVQGNISLNDTDVNPASKGYLELAADSAEPSFSGVTALSTYTGAGASTVSDTTKTVAGISVSGTLAEANPSILTVTATKNGTANSTYSRTLLSGTSGSFSFSVPAYIYNTSAGTKTEDNAGLWAFTLTATDLAGRTVTYSTNLTTTIDTTPPDLNISNVSSSSVLLNTDSAYSSSTGKYMVKFTWSDSGSGLSKLYYSTSASAGIDTSIDTSGSPDASIYWVDTGCATTATSFAFPVTENTGHIAFMAEDKMGNCTVVNYAVTVDLSAPTISALLADTDSDGSYDDTVPAYYTASVQGRSIVIQNTVTDVRLMGSTDNVTAFATLNGATATSNSTLTINKTLTDNKTVTVTFTIAVPAADQTDDGVWVFSVSGTDSAKQTGKTAAGATSSTTTFTVDTKAPALTWDSTSPVTYTKLYSEKYWTTSSVTTIKVVSSDTTTGVSSVKYAVIHESTDTTTPAVDEWATAKAGAADLTAGSDNSWSGKVSLEEGVNYIRVYAKDTAGNEVTQETDQILYCDMLAPSVSSVLDGTDSSTADTVTSVLSNGSSGITVYITPDDKNDPDQVSGTSTVKALIGTRSFSSGSPISATETTATSGIWELALSADNISSALTGVTSGTKTVYVQLTDNAGNTSTAASLFSIQVDKNAPTAKISQPTDADTTTTGIQVNKKITLSGTASDDQSLKSVILQYQTGSNIGTDTWATLDTTITGTYNWSTSEIDTTTAFGSLADGTNVAIRAAAQDTAGNTGSTTDGTTADTLTLIVNQDTDRPVITVNNLDMSGMTSLKSVWLKGSRKIYGTITDDDGIPSSGGLTIRYKYTGDASFTSPISLTVSSGSWNYTLPEDGTCEIEFIAVDSAGTAFTTAASVTKESVLLTTPKIVDSDGEKFGYSTGSNPDTMLNVTVDISNPELQSIKVSTDGGSTWIDSTSSLKLGGTVQSFCLRFDSYDVNGIDTKGLTVVTSGLTTASGSTKIAAATYTYGSSSDGRSTSAVDTSAVSTENFADTSKTIPYTTYTFKNIPCSTGDGSMIVTVTTTDMATNIKSSSVTLSVDNTSPVITVLGPSSSTTASGNITVYGSIDGSASMYYAVSPIGPDELDKTRSPDSDSASTTFTYDTADSSGNAITEKDAAAISAATVYTQITDASLSWYVYFDGGSGDTKTHSTTLNTWLDTLGITTTAAITGTTLTPPAYTDITKLYVWIKSIDAYGNKSETAYPVLLDPQGDRPTVDIDYPESDGTALGGTVKLYGSADDNSAVKNVFVQIMSEQHSVSDYTAHGTSFGTFVYNSSSYATETFTPSEDDLNYLAMAGYKIYKMSNTVTTDSTNYWVAGTNSLASGESASDYGILVTPNGSSWSLKINANGELNPSGDTSNIVAVRVYAYDDGNTKSLAADRTMKFDKNNPVFGSISLVQSEGITDAYKYNVGTTAEQECTSGMYVRGTWYIKGSITDDNGISDLIITDNNTDYSLVSGEAGKNAGTPVSSTVWEAVQSTDGKTCYFKYTLDTASGVGKHVITVTAKDGTTTQYTSTYSATVNYDNTAPVLGSSSDSSYNISPSVSQSDSFYTMSSTVTEASVSGVSQSGFERLAFYFVRRNGSTYAYDPMLIKGSSSNKIDLISGTNDSTIIYNSGLFWKVKTVTWSSDSANVITLSDADDNIHTGGLLKANGIIYTIKSVSTTAVTLDGNLTKDPETVYAALALVVDNTVSEGYSTSASLESDGYYSSGNLTNDDGDRMIEYVSNTGTVWSWQANVCSKNIPDGPIEIHYTAFDAAGNYSTGIVGHVDESHYEAYKTTTAYDTADVNAYAADSSVVSVYAYDSSNPAFVSNNRPRIAGVTIGTDYDNNGTVDSDEEESSYSAASYSADSVTGTTTGNKNIYDPTAKSRTKYKTVALPTDLALGNETSPLMTLKGYSEIIPEIVGGNGAIYYQYSCGSLSGKNSTTALVADGSTDYTIDTSETLKLQLGDLIKAGDADDTPFVFTFWDSTDGANTFAEEKGTNGRQYAKLTLYLGVSVQAVGTPEAKITPFYWNSSSDNSLYGNSTVNGHIELEEDWAKSAICGTTSTTDTLTAEYDADPKVSGQIVIRGTAHDNTRINKLYISVPGMENVFENTSGANITDTVTVNFVKYYCLAAYSSSSGKLVPVDDWSSYGFALSISKDTISSSGHDVNWAFTWDTSKISTVAATDVKVQVLAYNQGKPSCSTGSTYSALGHLSIDGTTYYSDPSYTGEKANTQSSTQTTSTTATSHYKMDVVPYIREITTDLSPLYKAGASVYCRTARGHYPVHENEEITLTGFNIGSSATATIKDTTLSSGTGTAGLSWNVGTTANSGELIVTEHDVMTLNNKNLNPAVTEVNDGTQTVASKASYNSKANGVNNNLLNDDTYIDVWQFKNAAEPKNGKIQNVTMKISPKGRIGFSFSNAVVYFSAPSIKSGSTVSTDYVYSQTAIAQNYGWFTNNSFCFDPYGYPYSCAQSPDTDNVYGAAFMQFFSRQTGKTVSNMGLNENYQKIKNSSRIEAIDIPIDSFLSDYTTDIDRTQSISMVATMPNANTIPATTSNEVTVHLAYYDHMTKQIRYRQGKIGSGPGDFGFVNGDNHGGSLLDLEGLNSSADTTSSRYNNSIDSFRKKIQHIYRVAGSDLGNAYATPYQVDTTHKGGRYVDIGVVTSTATNAKPTIVICWYDAVNKDLVMSYDTPSDNDIISNDGMTVGNWASRATTISDDGGMYCRMAVDANDGIHIAHYSNTGADLLYTYVPCSGGVPQMANAVTVTVDSFLSVGTNCTIDVAKVKNNYVPYIGYYVPSTQDTSACARIAYPVNFTNNYPTGAGANSKDLYTGNWEITTVPTSYTPITDRINVGLYKKNGVLTAVPVASNPAIALNSDSNTCTRTSETNTFPVSDSTIMYGNGSENPVVAYAVDEDGILEMAQQK